MDHWSDPSGTESHHMQLDYIYIYISMGYGGHQLRLKCAQVHDHSPAGTFARVPGRCLRWSPTPPGPRWSPALNIYNIQMNRDRSFTSIQTVHTHTHPAFGRVVSRQMRWRWGWKGEWTWNESENEMKDYSTGTRGGKRKTRGEEQTPTPTHLARSGQTLKGQGGGKAETDGHRARPAEGGEDGSAWTNLTQRNLRLPRHAQDPNGPDLPGEGKTHEIGDQMGN